MKNCPLCGRKYVDENLVVLPPTKEQVLTEWRARKRAARLAAAEAAIPPARASADSSVDGVLT